MTTDFRQVEQLATFMQARHDIYLKRLAGRPGPWTSDPVLRNGRFCNVFRELDTVTIWIRKNIRERYADHPHLWFMLAIARYINWPDTLSELMQTAQWPDREGFEPSWLTTALEHRAARKEKVYTGAYMIRAESNQKAEWYNWSKHRYITEIVLGRLWEKREQWTMLLNGGAYPGEPVKQEEVWGYFQSPYFIGWGPFMSYEVVTDLRHTRYLENAPDIYTWANAGPGAIRGLNRLHFRAHAQPLRQERANKEMFDLMLALNDLDTPEMNRVFGEVDDVNPRFEMRDVEHSLCEFDKWKRVMRGEGQMRSKYDWTQAKPITPRENI